MESDADEIKRRMMQQMQQEQEAQEQEEYVQAQKKVVLRHIMTPEARERLGRIRIAKPQFAEWLENQLIQLYQMGRIQEKLDDQQFQKLLKTLRPKKRDINIRRI
ncbi:MAG: DNA-binding protein [Candidatus Thermoplasmatota archaeon]|nr:DNA-binding protein [Candidatus Thermoplasmatota archaeon]